jgi:hypothetical protein
MRVCGCACSQHLKAAKAAADKAAAEKAAAKAAAEKASAEKAAAEKAAAAKAAAAKAAADKAAAERAAAEELRRRATALGLLQVLTTADIADDATLKKSMAFCDEKGVTNVSDMVEYNLVDDFVRHLGLKLVPGLKLRSMLQTPTSGLAAQLSDPLASPSRSSNKPSPESAAADKAAVAKAQQEADDAQLAAALAASLAVSGPATPPIPCTPTPPRSLAASRFMGSYNQPERKPDQLYALMTTDCHRFPERRAARYSRIGSS